MEFFLFSQSHKMSFRSLFLIFQAGEFFHSAQSSAAAQQSELEAQQTGEGSIDSPLLLEQV